MNRRDLLKALVGAPIAAAVASKLQAAPPEPKPLTIPSVITTRPSRSPSTPNANPWQVPSPFDQIPGVRKIYVYRESETFSRYEAFDHRGRPIEEGILQDGKLYTTHRNTYANYPQSYYRQSYFADEI